MMDGHVGCAEDQAGSDPVRMVTVMPTGAWPYVMALATSSLITRTARRGI
jgi:hypothetical protein